MIPPILRSLITTTGCLAFALSICASVSAATFFVTKPTDPTAASPGNTQLTQYRSTLLVPSTAMVSVSGRVMNARGKGLEKAYVTLTFSDRSIFTALTNSDGFYRVDGLIAGQTVVISVSAPQYSFRPQTLYLREDVNDLNFRSAQ